MNGLLGNLGNSSSSSSSRRTKNSKIVDVKLHRLRKLHAENRIDDKFAHCKFQALQSSYSTCDAYTSAVQAFRSHLALLHSCCVTPTVPLK